jgi:hypothetical protein
MARIELGGGGGTGGATQIQGRLANDVMTRNGFMQPPLLSASETLYETKPPRFREPQASMALTCTRHRRLTESGIRIRAI